jgi:NitT/TauT family transport system substrate-binding protein
MIRRIYLTMKLHNSRTIIILSIILFFAINWSVNKNIYAQEAETRATIEIGSLKGPTTMGMVKLMNDSEQGLTRNNYQVSMYGTADEIVTGIVSGKIDAAAVPCNLSSVLYNKTKGQVLVTAINTLGVLYLVESGNSVQSVGDLKGKTIYSTGKGTTPEFALNYILTQNGLEPGKDVTIEYKMNRLNGSIIRTK